MQVKQLKTCLAVVSVLLVLALLAQGLFWAGLFPSTEKETPYVFIENNGSLSHEGYTLEQVVVLSRHNIRAPLSGNGSVLDSLTPHQWYAWSSNASELSLRGGSLETMMGQYFRKWMESEGLLPENYQPQGQAIRFYANSKQRTLATAEYFSAGFLPVGNVSIENHVEFDTMDPVFTPKLNFMNDAYAADIRAQVSQLFQEKIDTLSDNYALLMKVVDMKQSSAWQEGTATELVTNDLELKLETDKEPTMTGSLKTACSLSDALVLQYFEESDPVQAAFGHRLSDAQWNEIAEIKDVYGDVLFTAPLVAPNVAHPLLQEIDNEMHAGNRMFTFLCGHDSSVGSVLASLGVEDYALPHTIEKKTPIGCKLVFARWKGADNQSYWSVDFVYQSTEQLRSLAMLDLEHPPVIASIDFVGLSKNEDGLYEAGALEERFQEAINQFDVLQKEYDIDIAA